MANNGHSDHHEAGTSHHSHSHINNSWHYPLTEYEGAEQAAQILEITCTIYNIFLFIYHSVQLHKQQKAQSIKKEEMGNDRVYKLSIFTMFCLLYMGLHQFLIHLDWKLEDIFHVNHI